MKTRISRDVAIARRPGRPTPAAMGTAGWVQTEADRVRLRTVLRAPPDWRAPATTSVPASTTEHGAPADIVRTGGHTLDPAQPRAGEQAETVAKHAPEVAATSAPPQIRRKAAGASLVLQRKCACGAGASDLTGECEECSKKKLMGLQTKLRVNEPGDVFEREADRVAEQVLAQPAHPDVGSAPPRIQRFSGQSSGEISAAPASVDRALASPGRPLELALRQDMEQRFGHDFSRVRVHSGTAAEQSAQDVNAHAYTVGHSIVFDAGRYAPETQKGRRLIAHELTHVVQQSGAGQLPAAQRGPLPIASNSPTATVQREVNPKRIASKDPVLDKIKTIADSVGKGKGPAEANLARLGKLGIGFNPGATKEEKDNAFVYTCHCGWIDMGHFFISAAAAYGVGYQRRRLETRVEGTPHTIDEVLTKGIDKLTPLLDFLLKTVPDEQAKNVLSDVRKLLRSGEPRDIALVFGYWMEFLQQVAKVVSDPGRSLPEPLKKQLKELLEGYQQTFKSVAPEQLQGTLEGSARSAFTMEDLPSDCYGAALGQDVWKQTDGAKMDSSPIHGLMKNFFSECGAVFPEPGSRTRCEMMAETTPGSCRMEGDKDVWPADLGEPARYASTKARLLSSAKPLCGDAAVVPCKSGTGAAGSPLPAAVLDVSARGKSATLTVPEDIGIYQPRERGDFGGEISFPGRPERIDRKPPLVLGGPTFLRLNTRGDVTAYSTLSGVQGLGDIEASASLSLTSGRFGVQARGPLEIHADGKLSIDFERLFQGLAGPELDQLKEVFKSEAFTDLVKKLFGGDLTTKEFLREVKSLLKQQFPQGLKGVLSTVLARLESIEPVALATSLHARGTVSVGGIPISGFLLHKSVGLRPLLGLEAGLVTSELAEGRVILGAKGWLYGDRLLQAQLTAGVDPIGRKVIAELHAVSKELTGNKLSVDLRYQINPEGEQQFFLVIGGEHNIKGSKPRGSK